MEQLDWRRCCLNRLFSVVTTIINRRILLIHFIFFGFGRLRRGLCVQSFLDSFVTIYTASGEGLNSYNGRNELVFNAVMMSSFSPRSASLAVDPNRTGGGLTMMCTCSSIGGSEKTLDNSCAGDNDRMCSVFAMQT